MGIQVKDADFVEASALLRVLEKRILSGSAINRIMDAPNAFEALRQISQNSSYDFTALKRTEDCEAVLLDELKKTYDLIYSMSPHRYVVDVPAAKYEFHNLKVALKSKYIGKDMRYLYSNTASADVKDIEAYIRRGDEGAPAEYDLPEYIRAALDDAEEAFLGSRDPQEIDIALDKRMFGRIMELCGEIQNSFITEYMQLNIDFYNVKTMFRAKNMLRNARFLERCLVPGGITDTGYFVEHFDKTPENIASVFFYKYFGDMVKKGTDAYARAGNFAVLEKLFDDRLVEQVKKAKLSAFGPEVLFAYILSKENEIRQIRILVACKNNGVKADALRERLRDNYA